jgi:hypothetical protein
MFRGVIVALSSMMHRAGILVIASAGLAGCSDAPDGPTDGPPDAPPPAGGLIFAWGTSPTLPGRLEDDLELAEASFQLRDVRALGDSAPGDGRTSRSAVELTWSAATQPGSLVFDQAPPGLYSRLELRLGGDGEAYWLRGRVEEEDDGEEEERWVTWEVRDDAALTITVPLDVTLAIGATTTVAIAIDAGELVHDIDWSRVPLRGGVRVLDAADAQIAGVRTRLTSGTFRATSP